MDFWQANKTVVDDTHLGFGKKAGYGISWKSGPVQLKSDNELIRDGTTPFDTKYMEGELLRRSQDRLMSFTEDEGRRKRLRTE